MATILTADIGGTHSRFALFEARNDTLEMVDAVWLDTHGAASFPELLGQLWDGPFKAAPGGFDAAVMAVAGAVEHGVACSVLPNAPWGVDLRRVDLGTATACLINDFAAQAYACRTKASDDAVILQQGRADDTGTIGVIGAGTGLGYSALLLTQAGWFALPSEGGHMAFPFTGQEEAAYGEFNRREAGRRWAEGDSVVTGLGLRLIHKYLTGEDLHPRDISRRIGPQSETTRWYARFYARACRNWAVALMCTGGLFIAGGVAAKNPMLVRVPEFLEEFHNTHVYGDFLRTVPVRLNANEQSGLFGAAFYGAQLLRQQTGQPS
ncbi:MAG: glucokinase [Pseudodesulfovibrio sp.]